jgi:hypothetical protein
LTTKYTCIRSEKNKRNAERSKRIWKEEITAARRGHSDSHFTQIATTFIKNIILNTDTTDKV